MRNPIRPAKLPVDPLEELRLRFAEHLVNAPFFCIMVGANYGRVVRLRWYDCLARSGGELALATNAEALVLVPALLEELQLLKTRALKKPAAREAMERAKAKKESG